jgi:hypothetical protein
MSVINDEHAPNRKPEPTYAELWAEEINNTYPADPALLEIFMDDAAEEGEDDLAAIRRILGKAAECLRNGIPATFTASELDLVRHLMPAHEVHQSGAKRWVLEAGLAGGVEGPKFDPPTPLSGEGAPPTNALGGLPRACVHLGSKVKHPSASAVGIVEGRNRTHGEPHCGHPVVEFGGKHKHDCDIQEAVTIGGGSFAPEYSDEAT